MMEKKWFLKPNVVIEPLFERWYAWLHLISPATSALNITGRHLKIMNSYIQSPAIHQAAVSNPKMLGGPFMDYERKRVDEVKDLRTRTEENQSNAIAFAQAIQELENMLAANAGGSSLEPLYKMVPNLLKGYVELIYDLNHRPSFRFYEPLLYQSEFYQKMSQSIALWLTENDDRPFCLSTPKLDDEGVLHLQLPFDDVRIDQLSKMKSEGGSLAEIAAVLGIEEQDQELFNTFFTLQERPGYQEYKGDKIRMRYFGHACILIETDKVSILVDPLISYYGYESGIDHYSDIDLPDTIDYVLITHNHQDHIVLETLIPLRHKIKNIIVPVTTSGLLQDPSLKLAFNNIGFNQVIGIDEMEEIKLGDCIITGLPFTGEHSDLNIRAKACFHVRTSGFSVLFVADSSIVEPKIYEHVQRLTGDIDVIFLGMECDGAPLSWLYGPLLPNGISREHDQSRRLSGSNCEKGMSLINIFHPKEVYVYAMGQEPWLKFISSIKYTEESNPIIQSDQLIAECKALNIVAERLYGEKELLYDYAIELAGNDNS